MDNQFAQDVLDGLLDNPKTLPSKYFYDKKGDALFQEIMALDEYYLTRAEYAILDTHKARLLKMLRKNQNGKPFQLIEFGAGDGLKTKVLLKHFLEQEANFEYLPIDISANVLRQLGSDLKATFPGLKVEGMEGDYFEALGRIPKDVAGKKLVLFLGSNIGNFTPEQALEFLGKLANNLEVGDGVLVGVDLKKEPKVIQKAYNDQQGVTKAFNLNLLTRINEELGANFKLEHFMHYPVYEPLSGMAKSYLVSTREQTVDLKKLNKQIEFEAWEAVHTEISRKFSPKDIGLLAEAAGFRVVENFFDDKGYFVDSFWEKI